MAKYADDARQRIRAKLKHFTGIVQQAKARNLNEADTRDIVKAMMGDLLGLDPFFEVTGEFAIKGQYADFAVKFEDRIQYFVEVKSIDAKLDDKHLFQVIGYAANHGVEWAVLTNSEQWIVYRLFAGEERRTEVVVCLSLTADPPAELVEKFFLFSKEGFRQRALESQWVSLQALHPKRVTEALFTDAILGMIRKEVAKQGRIKVEDSTIRDILLNQVIRGDLADQMKSTPKPVRKKATKSESEPEN